MKRRLFTILSALSLVLGLGCLLMGMRSGSRFDFVRKEHGGGRSWTFFSLGGSLGLAIENCSPPRPGLQQGPWTWDVMPERSWSSQQGPAWDSGWPAYETRTLPRSGYVVIRQEARLPYWLMTYAASVLPILWCWRHRHNLRDSLRWFMSRHYRRKSAGLCRVCGYDLRASPEPCPECDAPSPASPPALSPSDPAGLIGNVLLSDLQ